MPRVGCGTAIAGAIREAARRAPAGAAGPASDACASELERLLVHEGAVGLVDFTGLTVTDAKAVWPPLARWADEFVNEFLSAAPYDCRKIGRCVPGTRGPGAQATARARQPSAPGRPSQGPVPRAVPAHPPAGDAQILPARPRARAERPTQEKALEALLMITLARATGQAGREGVRDTARPRCAFGVQVPIPTALAASLRRMHSLQTVSCGFATGVGAPARAGPVDASVVNLPRASTATRRAFTITRPAFAHVTFVFLKKAVFAT